MGFLDKAKAMADELAQKADTALAGSGLGGPGTSMDADRYLRDLGVIAYLEANGRAVSAEDKDRVMAALRELEQRGAIGSLTLQTTAAQASAVPPPPGAAAQTPPPPAAGQATSPVEEPPAPQAAQPKQSAPPPPSWAKDDDA